MGGKRGNIDIGFVTNEDVGFESLSKSKSGFVYFYSTYGVNDTNGMDQCKEGDIIGIYLDLLEFNIKYKINNGQIKILQNLGRDEKYKMAVSCNEISDSISMVSHTICGSWDGFREKKSRKRRTMSSDDDDDELPRKKRRFDTNHNRE